MISFEKGDPPPRLSVVIAAWNAGDDLYACLESLHEFPGPQPTEVILVDNGSQDGSVQRALEAFPGTRLIRNPTNRGVARARNQGLRAARAPAILLLDADTRVTAGAIATLCDILDREPDVGLVGPRLEYPDGRLQLSARAYPRLRSLVFARPPFSKLLPDHWTVREHHLADWDHSTSAEVDYVLGACQLIRSEALRQVGLLDERIFYGPEDADFCLRLHAAGWRILYEPAARVVHRYRRMTVRAPLSRQARALVLGYARLFVRHRRRRVRRRLP